MTTNRLNKTIGFLLSPRRIWLAIRSPKIAIYGFLIPLLKHPVLFQKTRNIKGYTTPEVGVALYETVLKSKHKSSNVVEVGYIQGLSTIYLSEAAKQVHKRVKSFDWFSGLTNLDPMLDSNFKVVDLVSDANIWDSNVRKNGCRERVDLTIGDASQTMLPVIQKNGFAVAFLDVDLYDLTFALLCQLRSVATGGEVIFIHNADSPGIQKAICEFQALWKHQLKEQYLAGHTTAKLAIPLHQ